MNLKGKMTANLYNQCLPITWSQKDLGLIVNDSLNWTENCGKRCSNGFSDLFQIKNLSEKTHWRTKLNAFLLRSTYTYICLSGLVAKQNEHEAIGKCSKESHKMDPFSERRLRSLNLLPLSQYMELHDLLMSIDIINNKFDYQLLFHGNDQSFTRQGVRGEFPLAKNRLTKTINEYFRRTQTVYNHVLRKLRGAMDR